jgi:hypothetical protein
MCQEEKLMLTKVKLAAAALLVTAMTTFAVNQPAPATKLEGILKAVDADKGTLEIMITRDKDENITYPLAKNVAVTINGSRIGYLKKDGQLADLKQGMRIRIRLGDDKKTIANVDEVRSQQGAQPRACEKCKSACGLELSREWCESFDLYRLQMNCWCQIAQYHIGATGGRCAESQKVTEKEWNDTMDKAYADAKKAGKMVLHIGNTGG